MALRWRRVSYDASFSTFRGMLHSMLTADGKAVSGMEMYQLVYEMCTASPKPYTERLFLGIAEYFEDFCDGKREEILAQNDILYAYAKEFRSYHLVADYASRICDTLNRLLLKVHEGGTKRKIISSSERRYERQTIQALALLIWKERVVIAIRNSHNNRLLYQVLESITRDRDGEDVSQDAIHTVVNSLVRLDEFIDQPRSLYIEEFERPYLIHTKNYYQREAARVIATNSISDYMIQANSRLIQEAARNKRFCHQTTHERAVKECEAQYVAAYQSRIQGEFEQMIHHERYEGKYCKLAYSLLSRLTDGLKELLEIYQSYITKLGKDILARLGQSVAKDPREYVESLLNLQSRYYAISNNVFSGDATFVAAVDKAFRAIINDTVTNKYAQGPELLAKYCDLLLKRGSAKKEASAVAAAGSKTAATQVNGADMVDADIDVEHRLTQLVILFKYVDDKDVFQKFYSRMLAKRLIYGTSISEEAEAGMIARLKAMEYTSKLHKMFTDMTVSADLNTRFKDFLDQSELKLGVGFDILVLTAGAWPLSQSSSTDVQIPAELEKSVTRFTTFYNNHHNGRKLSWLWHLSKGDLRLTYLNKPYELAVSIYQMAILLLFNTNDTLTLQDILDHATLKDTEAKRAIKPLIELKILNCNTTELEPSSDISLNMSFSSKRTKLKPSAAVQSDTPQETTQTHASINQDRNLHLQATIVRLLKSRKRMSHTQLMTDVIDQVKGRFKADVVVVKRCVEVLLEKGYMERDGRDWYVYVA